LPRTACSRRGQYNGVLELLDPVVERSHLVAAAVMLLEKLYQTIQHLSDLRLLICHLLCLSHRGRLSEVAALRPASLVSKSWRSISAQFCAGVDTRCLASMPPLYKLSTMLGNADTIAHIEELLWEGG
jgi:hypothetical protein